MTISFQIRPEGAQDEAAIREVLFSAFTNHPQHAPGQPPTEHRIVDCLRNEGALKLSLVAESAEGILGMVALSPVYIGGKEEHWYGLGPVGVLPAFQKQGIGSALIRKGLELLKNEGAKGVVLVGKPEYYQRFGFVHFPKLILEGVPPEVFMALNWDSSIPVGAVIFHPAFFIPPE